jgi:hypothetical protein
MQQLVKLLAPALAAAITATAPRAARAGEPGSDDDDKAEKSKADEAKAEEERAAEEARLERAKGVKVTFRLGVRFLQSAPFSKVYENVLTAYGYGSMSALLEAAGDVAVSPASWLDLGVHTGYAFGNGGSDGGSGGLLTLHVLEVGGFACGILGRSDRRRAGNFGFGVEGGAMVPFLLLRGEATTARLPYVGPVLLGRFFGSGMVQTAVHVRYLVANWSDAFGSVGLPLGGFSVSVGANLSL